MTQAIVDALAEASASFDRIRNDLNFADSRFTRDARERDRIACLNASAYIWMASIVERFIKRVLASVLEEINGRGVRRDQIRYCLFALAIANDLDSMEHSQRLKKWRQRARAFDSVADSAPVVFNTAIMPIDGRTIRGDHLETIWQTLGLSGDPVPHPRCMLALSDLADGRNNLAHGEVDPVAFGRRKTISDVRRLVDTVEDVVLHVCEASQRYLANNEYVR
jgi:hypothetical protein